MIKYLSSINGNNHFTIEELSNILKIRKDSVLDALRKKQYQRFVKIEGKGVNRSPFAISITIEGRDFLKLIESLRKLSFNKYS